MDGPICTECGGPNEDGDCCLFKEDLVAVLLPREVVEQGIYEWTEDQVDAVQAACKKALKPKVPGAFLSTLRDMESMAGQQIDPPYGEARQAVQLTKSQWAEVLPYLEYAMRELGDKP